jgi:hypothetical protein
MAKFMDRLDLQIRMHLAVRHLLALIIYNYGDIPINSKLEEWYRLSWNEFFEEIKSAGISIKDESDRFYLQETFEEQKRRVLSIMDELNRHDEIVSNNKVKF